MYTSRINSLNQQIIRVQNEQAREIRKEADILTRINRVNDAASRTRSPSTAQSKLREVERLTRQLGSTKKTQANLSTKLSQLSNRLQHYEGLQSRYIVRKQKERDDEQRRLIRHQERQQHLVHSVSYQPMGIVSSASGKSGTDIQYDFFICHASEDKDGIARQLAEILEQRGVRVWFDEFTLSIGDSLRREIDRGLANSLFGVVILSEFFFQKEWPQKELDGLTALEADGRTRILPIWHQLSKDRVALYSPTLADKVALSTDTTDAETIADELCKRLG